MDTKKVTECIITSKTLITREIGSEMRNRVEALSKVQKGSFKVYGKMTKNMVVGRWSSPMAQFLKDSGSMTDIYRGM